MAERLSRPAGALFLVLALYFIVNIVVRVSLPGSLELDEAEQVFYSQWLRLGYGSQPPLYNWLQIAIFTITGKSVFGLSLLKNLLLFSAYLFYWLAARRVLKDRVLQIAAVLGLLTLPQVSFMAEQDLAHTVALIAATALFLYAFYRIIERGDTTGYLIAGLAIGLGFLSKYNFALLPIAALLAVLPERALRDRIFNWRLLLAMALALAIILPHLFWLAGHLDLATAETLRKMKDNRQTAIGLLTMLKGFGSLVVALIAFAGLTLAIFAAIYRRQAWHVLGQRSSQIRITERMLVILLLVLVVIVFYTGTTQVRERWLDPFLLVLPLYIGMKIEAAGMAQKLRRTALLGLPLLVMVVVPASIALRVVTASFTGAYTRVNTPFDRLTDVIRLDRQPPPAAIIASDRHMAGSIMLAFAGVPVMTSQYPELQLPFTADADHPVLLVWRATKSPDMPVELQRWAAAEMPGAGPVQARIAQLPYHYARRGDSDRFGYAWLAPKQR
jgi:4-amino-4-deoxy-L-arabinose transferase-like glycosyltransferase